MISQDWRFRDDTNEVFTMPVPLRHQVAYLNYSCLPRAPDAPDRQSVNRRDRNEGQFSIKTSAHQKKGTNNA